MVADLVPRHGPAMHRTHARAPGADPPGTAMEKILEALPALLLAAALILPALAVLA